MGHAVSTHQDLSRLIYANIKIDDVPGFTAGILNFSYISGWLHSRTDHTWSVLKTLFLSLEQASLGKNTLNAFQQFPAREESSFCVIKEGERLRILCLTSLDSFQ